MCFHKYLRRMQRDKTFSIVGKQAVLGASNFDQCNHVLSNELIFDARAFPSSLNESTATNHRTVLS